MKIITINVNVRRFLSIHFLKQFIKMKIRLKLQSNIYSNILVFLMYI